MGALAGEDCELQPAGKKWTNAGCVFGPQRAVAWRVLDAQYFGVAQRRRRVFVVASARKGFNPTEVLFEFDGVRRDIAPSRSSGKEVARSTGESPYLASGKSAIGTLMANAGTKLWLGNQEAFSGDYFVCHGTQDPIIQPVDNNPKLYDAYQHHGWREGETCGTLTVGQNNTIRGDTPVVIHATQDNQAFPLGCNHGQENAVYCGAQNDACRDVGYQIAPTLRAGNGGGAVNPVVNEPVTYGIPGNWIGRKPENGGNATEPMDNIAPCQTKTDRHAVAYGIQGNMIGRSDTAGSQGSGVSSNISFTLTKGDKHAVATSLVRRLTPTECERLQGFPDSYTKIPYRNKKADDCPDGPRYAALGNSMAVPVMRWIGERIQKHIDGAI